MKQTVKTTKNVGGNGKLLKIALFLLVVSTLVYQLRNIDWETADGLNLKYPLALLGALILVSANLWMEYLKWQLIASRLTSEKKAIRSAFWSGISTGFVTPNGWGNFLGRLLYFSKRETVYIIIATAFSNLSQLLPTLVFGIYAAGFVFPHLFYVFVFAGSVLLVVYFFADRLIPVTKARSKWIRRFQLHALIYRELKVGLLTYSVLRFFIFTVQYVLLFVAFGYTDWFFLTEKIWLIYFITAFVPSLWSGKILIRESAALFVFENSGVEITDILVASLLIYLINIALPAFWSSLVWIPGQLKK